MNLFELFQDPASMQEILTSDFKLVDITQIPDEDINKHQQVALMEYVQKYARQRDLRSLLEKLLKGKVVQSISSEDYGSYRVGVIKYLASRHDFEYVKDAVPLLSRVFDQEEEETMTLAERWEQQGVEKGMQQGVQQGMQQERRLVAQKLKQAGQSAEFIEQITGLKLEEV